MTPSYAQAMERFHQTGNTDWLDAYQAAQRGTVPFGSLAPPELADPAIAEYVKQQQAWKGGLLPVSGDATGTRFDMSAGLPGVIGRALAVPGQAARGQWAMPFPMSLHAGLTSGQEPPQKDALLNQLGFNVKPVRSTRVDEALEPVFDLAGVVMGGGLPGAEAGAVGAMGGRLSQEAMEAGKLRAVEMRNQGIPTGKDAPGWAFKRPDPVEGTPEWDAAVARAEARQPAPAATLSPEDVAAIADPAFVTPNTARVVMPTSQLGTGYQSLLDSFEAPRAAPVTNRDVTLGSGDTSGVGQARTAATLSAAEAARQNRMFNQLADSEVVVGPTSSREAGPFRTPQTVYHGRQADFDAFDPNSQGTVSSVLGSVKVDRVGQFFADDPEFAGSFATQGGRTEGANIIPAHLDIRKPLHMTPEGLAKEDVDNLVAQGVDRRWLENYAGDPRSTWEAFDGENGQFFADAMRKAGYDGARFFEVDPDTGKTQGVWMTLDPSQVRSKFAQFAPENRGKNMLLGSGDTSGAGQARTAAVLGLRDQQTGLYSALERAVDAAPNQRAPGQQWLNTLANRPGVKPEELEWTGLRQFLEERRGQPVTKDDIAEHLTSNRVRLQEKIRYDDPDGDAPPTRYSAYQLGGDSRNYMERLTMLPERDISDAAALAEAKRFSAQLGEDWNRVPAHLQQHYIEGARRQLRQQGGDTATYKSPHWDEPNVMIHTRESDRVMTVPLTPEQIAANQTRASIEEQIAANRAMQGKVSREGWDATKPLEQARKDAIIADIKAGRVSGAEGMRRLEEYVEYPELKPMQARLEALRAEEAALRASMPEAVTPTTKRTKLIDEVQSDMHQAGRKHGYRRAGEGPEKGEVFDQGAGTWGVRWPDGTFSGGYSRDAALDVAEAGRKGSAIPDAPFKKNWHELALKRALVDAAEQGYDRLAWTPGDAQAARYDLGAHLKELHYRKHDDGTYEIGGVKKDGDGFNHPGTYKQDELADIVGKEMAEKIVRNEGKHPRGWPSGHGLIEGVDLKIGGEGMRGFYDKIIPEALQKLTKQWGVKVQKDQTGAESYAIYSKQTGKRVTDEFTSKAEADKFHESSFGFGFEVRPTGKKSESLWYIDIPDKMRADIKEKGFALFAGNENQRTVNAALAANRERAVQGLNEQATASTAARQADDAVLGLDRESLGRGVGGGDRSLEEASRSAARVAAGARPVEGLPSKALEIGKGSGNWYVPGPIKAIRDVADQYMAARGETYTPPTRYVPVNPERSTNIAKAFDEMQHAPDDPRVRASYDAMINETIAQYRAMENSGLKIEFIPEGMPDPYALSPRQAAIDVADNNHLWVFPTESGYGQAGMEAAAAGNPMLRPTGIEIGGHNLLANDVFRIVHDYFGHLKEGHGFRAAGEDNAWRTHAAMYSRDALPAMTSETRGQNSWVNYGPHGEKNRTASSADTVYAEQKVGLLPDWVWDDLAESTAPKRGDVTLGAGSMDRRGDVVGAISLTGKGYQDALWHDVSKIKLPKPVSEMESVVKQTSNNPDRTISPSALQGGRLVPVQGDRTRSGGQLWGVNGYKFDDPVSLEGGPSFMRDNMAAWASSGPVAQQVQNKVMAAGLKDDPVYGVTVAMGGRSGDYAHMNAGAMARMIEQAPLTNAAKATFDQEIMGKGVVDWPGLNSPKLKAYLDQRDKGEVRKLFMQMVDTKRYQKLGFPSAAEARVATTEPRLLNEPTGASGFSIARMDPRGDITPSKHTTYSHDIPGSYFGSLAATVPKEVMFPKMSEAITGYLDNMSGYKPTADYLFGRLPRGLPKTEVADQQWVDNVSKYLEDRGFTVGSGDVSGKGQARTAAVLGQERDGIKAYHGSPHDFDRFDMSKIGTGEGEQVFGHGLYFAGAEKTAQHYRDILSKMGNPRLSFDGKPLDSVWREKIENVFADRLGGLPEAKRKPLVDVLGTLSEVRTKKDADSIVRDLSPESQQVYREVVRPSLGKTKSSRGRMYEVNLDVDPEMLLQFEKPYHQQPAYVQNVLRDGVMDAAKRQKEAALQMLKKYPSGSRAGRALADLPPLARARAIADVEQWEKLARSEIEEIANDKTGKQLYTQAGLPATSPEDGFPKSTAALLAKGIPGLRYLDAMSRPLIEDGPKGYTVTMGEKSYGPFKTVEKATAEADKRASHNYVIFDDRLIKILRKYGIVVPGAAAAAGGFGSLAPEEL